MYLRKQVIEISLLADRFPSSFFAHPSEDLRAMILVYPKQICILLILCQELNSNLYFLN